MDARDPQQWVDEPVRHALDAVLYRWLALFCAPVAVAVVHKLASDHPTIDSAVHLGLPLFLVAYISVHLVGRFWRRRGAPDGWACAEHADHGTVAVTRTIGWVAVIGSAMACVAPLGSMGDPRTFLEEVLLWSMVLVPLYCLAVWVTIDCARHRLGRAVDASRKRVFDYWHDVAGAGRGSSA
jgi:hypothetical protein